MSNIYREALDMQTVTDLSVVVAHFVTALAVCRLYAEQVAWLTGAGSCPNHRSYLRARAECERKSKN